MGTLKNVLQIYRQFRTSPKKFWPSLAYFVKVKSKFHPIKGHEDPEGE